MSIHYREEERYFVVVGHTYPHREKLKSVGGFFDGSIKAWRLQKTPEAMEMLRLTCGEVGGGPLATVSGVAPQIKESLRAATVLPLLKTQEAADLPSPPPISAVPLENSTQADEAWSIAQIVQRTHVAIAGTFTRPIWVVGEIQNISLRGLGYFMALSEAKNAETHQGTLSISATLWRQAARQLETRLDLKTILADGQKVRVLCQVGFYRDRASLSLNIIDIDPAYTQGQMALARLQLIRELTAAGLMERNKRLTLSGFPLRIGLISADQSRAKTDFIDQLATYNFPGTVFFVDARMQGESLVREVTRALQLLSTAGVDAIILTRGGGSAADLRWFDAREIALAIVNAPVPVIAAIGHHDDTCVAEMVAFHREKTPTAAADFMVATLQQSRTRIDDLSVQLVVRLRDRFQAMRERVSRAADQLMLAAVRGFQGNLERVQGLVRTLERAFERSLGMRLEQLMILESKLKTLDPQPWLKRGWTQLWRHKELLLQARDVQVGERLHARLQDGVIELEVKGKENDN